MSIYRELAYDRPTARIQGIQFCVLSPDEIRRRSVCEVTENQAFQGNEPVPGGMFDTRMGVIDNAHTCATCHQRVTFCPGHFGHVTLAKPVFYVQFSALVRKITRCVCFRCSRLLVDLASPKVQAVLARRMSHQKRWEAMSKLCTLVKRCGQETLDGCGALQPDKVVTTEDMRLRMQWTRQPPSAAARAQAATAAAAASTTTAAELNSVDAAEDQAAPAASAAASGPVQRELLLTAEDVLRILRRVTDGDCEALGFPTAYNRPDWMICTVMPVPPPAVRPSVRHETGQRQEDDLTHKLADIIKFNNIVRDKMANGSAYESVEHYVMCLQYHVATLIDNSVPTLCPSKDRAGRKFRSLTERLKHKEGRIRGNLMGKRVDFSARTVITPDPNLSIDELGVPLRIAINLTFPEIVHAGNMSDMRRLVQNGPDVYPGAKHVRKTHEGGRTIRLKGHPDPGGIVLAEGDVVERHLRNGDWVLFNRQPSLHKMSMMAHRVRVMDYNTFRLNVCVCASYNADFDGDEMNMHVPQSLQTHYELRELAAVPLHIISPRYSKPIITIVQDVALGVYRMTQGDVRVPQRLLFNLVASNPQLDVATLLRAASAGGDRVWTGREVLSTVLPPAINVRMRSSERERDSPGYVAEDEEVVIESGAIRQGVLSTRVFKKESVGLVHATYNTLGPAAVTAMLNNTQKLVCDWLVNSGFSVGVSDLVVSPDTVASMRVHLDSAKDTTHELLRKVHTGTFENISTRSDADFLEEQIIAALEKGASSANKVGSAQFQVRDNRMLNMIDSGSKGKAVNFQQMVACVGLQSIEKKRVPDGFDGRTLPHFTKYDDGPEARGFVERSFIQGLAPHEFFFHSMAGRIGLIDTAVRSVTANTPIVVVEGGRPRRVCIGEWVDAHIARAVREGREVQVYPDDRNLELCELDIDVRIPTVDGAGNVTWGRMTAVTRHDPGERLYQVRTRGGREVTVAESRSLLVWRDGEFKPTESPDVRVGDFLPVTARLPAAPVTTEAVDMAAYFPKDQYVHGTEYNRAARWVAALHAGDDDNESSDEDGGRDAVDARRLVTEAQSDSFDIPRGWWAANNGTAFTLPYPSKACFSASERVEDGYVYVYLATLVSAPPLPDRFELSEENGVFVGLYLADGHACDESGIVGITKNDPTVRQWVEAWFDKHSITHRVQANTNRLGTSYTLRGDSMLLARFLDAFVGHGAHDKRVPDVAFTAPDAFVRGLLSGYFSGDGTVGKGSLCSSSVSARLTEGIAMLCSRLGAFGKISVTTPRADNNLGTVNIAPWHCLSVRAQWGSRLADRLQLVLPAKAQALQSAHFAGSHANFVEQRDVVLDPVEEIKVLDVDISAHPKLYDVTVPSTLNFVIANGLGVHDTSETGYIQRKLVKAMEDCKIQHDLTVRNAIGYVIQFLYGEDGMDAIKLEYQKLPYLGGGPAASDPAALRDGFLLSAADELEGFLQPRVLEELRRSEAAWVGRLRDHFAAVLADRRAVILNLHEGKEQDQALVFPVHVGRIVETTAELYRAAAGGSAPNLSDLHPLEVLDAIDKLCRELRVGAEPLDPAPSPHVPHTHWMPVLLRAFLSPKQLIRRHRLTKVGFDRVIQAVRSAFFASIASPSEMAGIVAAQSIGEPATQLSVSTWTRIQVAHVRGHDGKSMYDGPIGAFIDGLFERHQHKVVHLGGNSMVLDLDPELMDHRIVGVSNEEKTSWRPISQVSRHPANGPLIRVKTRSGREVTCTMSHSFLKRTESGIEPVKGSDLKLGDRMPVARYVNPSPTHVKSVHIGGQDVPLTRDFGWLCGAYLADGHVSSVHGELTGEVVISKVIVEYQEQLGRTYRSVFGLEMWQTFKHASAEGGGKTLHGWDMSKYPGTMNHVRNRPLATFLHDNFRTGSFDKRIPAWVYAAPLDFIKGLLGGYVDGDGNVNAMLGKQMIRTASVSEQLTEDFILLLTRVGVYASKCVERHFKEAGRNDLHTAQIPRKYARRFKEEVGLVVQDKARALDEIIAYVESDERQSTHEEIDMIPELGNVIAGVGKALRMDGQSRLYGKYARSGAAVGRRALAEYYVRFEAALAERQAADEAAYLERSEAISALRGHLDAAAPVPGRNEMLPLPPSLGSAIAHLGRGKTSGGLGAPPGTGAMAQWAKAERIGRATLSKFVDHFAAAAEQDRGQLDREVEPGMAVLRQALAADVVWDEITVLEVLPDDGQLVYDFTVPGNDSFMVGCGVLVHNTLNSVEYGTEMLLRDADTKRLERVQIGEFIEAEVERAKGDGRGRLEAHANDTWLAQLDRPLEVQSCDKDGRILWSRVEAVTKHPVVNEDGSDTLLKVTLRSGRSVVATKAKSFLARVANEVVPVEGKDLKVGDHVPVARVLHVAPEDELHEWPVSKYVTDGPLCYTLDAQFGFLVGAYMSDGGSCTATHVVVPTFDEASRSKVWGLCGSWRVSYHSERDDACTCVLSASLARLLSTACGGGTPGAKVVPAELLSANMPFVTALLDGFFSGAADVSQADIHVDSASRPVLDAVQQMLLRHGVMSEVWGSEEQGLRLGICGGELARFAHAVPLTARSKHIDVCALVKDACPSYDVVPRLSLSACGELAAVHRDQLEGMLSRCNPDSEDAEVLRRAMAEQVYWDTIVGIEEVTNAPRTHVYDLTVEGTRNFNTFSGVCLRDTFHLTGTAQAAKLTNGVPRIKELLSVSRNIKTPSMVICLRRDWATSMERAKEVMANMQTTRFRDLVRVSTVHYDPHDSERTTVTEDRGLMRFYSELSALEPGMGAGGAPSPWLLRFEFDRAKMLDLQITMLDLEHELRSHFDDTVSAVFSDDNAERLVCRLRLRLEPGAPGTDDLLTEVRALEQAIIESSVVKGVPGIQRAMLDPPNKGMRLYDVVTDAFVPQDEWKIQTLGSNMREVLALEHVDATRTTTNDVHEVYTVLGIEAARAALLTELRGVLQSEPLDQRHLSLLADTMSNRGFFMSIDRHGINHRGELGPLAKCSFEQNADMLIKAGVFAERDRINGVSANIMLGQVAPCGTGDNEVLLDTEMLARLAPPVPLESLTPHVNPATAPASASSTGASSAPPPPLVLPSLELQAERADGPAQARVEADEIEIV